MKLLALIGVGLAASYCYINMKNKNLSLSNLDFDENIHKVVIQNFWV